MKKHSAETLKSIWGHGYHKAKENIEKGKKVESLIGKWFHSFDKDEKIQWQGRVLSAEQEGYFLIQLYRWIDGCPTDQKLIPFYDMIKWNFYDTDKDMRYAHFKTQNRPEREFEQDEKFIQSFL